jgi:hypothetical protein
MDDAFSLVASRMPRSRRLTVFDIRLLVLAGVAVFLIAVFAAFVISQQRAADVRRAQALANEQAAASAHAAASLVADTGSPTAVDRQAQGAADDALRAATQLGPAEATAAGLTDAVSGLLFVDGPSTAPTVVSVYAGSAGWAAAVRGASETCYWVAMTPQGNDRYGTGTSCTGLDALGADQPSW